MKLFVTSDWHIGHKNILMYAQRPYETHEECTFDIIKRYNEIVGPNDVCINLGDLTMHVPKKKYQQYQQHLNVLNGIKFLVRGNHDEEPDHFYTDGGFNIIEKFDTKDARFGHYPTTTSLGGKIKHCFFGHIHNTEVTPVNGVNMVNVCIDYRPNDFYPVEITDENIKQQVLEHLELIDRVPETGTFKLTEF